MKKVIYTILFLVMASISLVAGLVYYSREEEDNGFYRVFNPEFLTRGKTLDLKQNSWYIAGNDSVNIYLGNYLSPNQIIIAHLEGLTTQNIRLNFHTKKKMNTPDMFMRVLYPYIYLFVGSTPLILRGTIGDYNMQEFITQSPQFYAHFGSPVSTSSFIVKTYDTNLNQYILSKISKNSPYLQSNSKSLTKQIDGIFCTEGLLTSFIDSSQFVFNYVYRNEYLVFDSSLNVISKYRTIDTNTIAKLQIAKIRSQNQLVFSKPPLKINVISCIFKDLLFVRSKLKARNETIQAYQTSSAIDVYSLRDGDYKFSFHLPDYYGQKISNMIVINKTLVVMQGRVLNTFDLGL